MDIADYQIPIEGSSDVSQWDVVTIRRVYAQVFRASFDAPGLTLLSFRESIESRQLRSYMWALKNSLSALHEKQTGKHLVYLSMGRFDSQVTTKFHLDGAPDEAFLMLGYEATSVQSELAVADYSHAAHDWGITPRELLADYNPMFADNERRLLPYVKRLTEFDPAHSHILLLNNSALPYEANSQNLLGVMHQATITPNPQAQRIINSTMMTTVTSSSDEPINIDLQRQFVETDEITGAL